MQKLTDALVEPLDPETQAAVDAVCGALDDPWGVPTGDLGPRFGFALYQAAVHGSPECRQRIFAAVEAGVRDDPEVFISAGQQGGKSGYIYTNQQIGEYRGKFDYEENEAGQTRRVLRWPTGTYASGLPCYERRDAA